MREMFYGASKTMQIKAKLRWRTGLSGLGAILTGAPAPPLSGRDLAVPTTVRASARRRDAMASLPCTLHGRKHTPLVWHKGI